MEPQRGLPGWLRGWNLHLNLHLAGRPEGIMPQHGIAEKAPGFAEKAAGFAQKAAGFAQAAPPNFVNS